MGRLQLIARTTIGGRWGRRIAGCSKQQSESLASYPWLSSFWLNAPFSCLIVYFLSLIPFAQTINGFVCILHVSLHLRNHTLIHLNQNFNLIGAIVNHPTFDPERINTHPNIIKPSKWGYLQIIHFNGIFPYKLSILGFPRLMETPNISITNKSLFAITSINHYSLFITIDESIYQSHNFIFHSKPSILGSFWVPPKVWKPPFHWSFLGVSEAAAGDDHSQGERPHGAPWGRTPAPLLLGVGAPEFWDLWGVPIEHPDIIIHT